MQLGRQPWSSGRPAFFVLVCPLPQAPGHTGLQARFPVRGGSVLNPRAQLRQGSLSRRGGAGGACQPCLPVPSAQAVHCLSFPLQWLLRQPSAGAAEDSRPHSLPSPLSLAFALGQRTLKPLQLLGLAHPASFVVTELCGSSGHHRSPVAPGQGQEEERRLMSGLFRAKWTAGGRLCFAACCGPQRRPLSPSPATRRGVSTQAQVF